jgi:hypothetical protein
MFQYAVILFFVTQSVPVGSRLKVAAGLAALVASFFDTFPQAVVNGVFPSNYVRLLSVLINGRTPFH